MKLCISNNINKDSHILGEYSYRFNKIIEWLNKINIIDNVNEDIYIELLKVELFNKVIKNNLLFIFERYKYNTKGVPLVLLEKSIKVPPKKDVLSEINFIRNIYNSNIDIIKNKGIVYFDYYNYDYAIDIAFRCFEKNINIYEKQLFFKNFSYLCDLFYRDSSTVIDFNNSIASMVNNKIIEIDNKTFHLTNKGKRIFSAVKGV